VPTGKAKEDDLHFSWQAQHFGDFHRHFAWQVPHFRRFVLRVFCELQCQGGVCVQIAWQACGTVKVLFFVGCAAFGEDPPCVECDFAW